jgi:hypothetical protein
MPRIKTKLGRDIKSFEKKLLNVQNDYINKRQRNKECR